MKLIHEQSLVKMCPNVFLLTLFAWPCHPGSDPCFQQRHFRMTAIFEQLPNNLMPKRFYNSNQIPQYDNNYKKNPPISFHTNLINNAPFPAATQNGCCDQLIPCTFQWQLSPSQISDGPGNFNTRPPSLKPRVDPIKHLISPTILTMFPTNDFPENCPLFSPNSQATTVFIWHRAAYSHTGLTDGVDNTATL